MAIKENLMFCLIILGVMLIAFSVYLLGYVRYGHYIGFGGLLPMTGLGMVIYALRADYDRKYLDALIGIVLLAMCLMFLGAVQTSNFNTILGIAPLDYSWTMVLLPILLASLVILFMLYPISRY